MILNYIFWLDIINFFLFFIMTMIIIGINQELFNFKKMVMDMKKPLPSLFYDADLKKSFLSFRMISLVLSILVIHIFENNIKTEISLFIFYYVTYALVPIYFITEMFITCPEILHLIFIEKEILNQKGNNTNGGISNN